MKARRTSWPRRCALLALADRPEEVHREETQTTAIRCRWSHSSSAYSLPVVMPSGSVMTAAAMMSCQPQKWTLAAQVANSADLAQRCAGRRSSYGREHHVAAAEREDHRVGVQRPEAAVGQPGPRFSLGQVSCAAMMTPTSMPTMPIAPQRAKTLTWRRYRTPALRGRRRVVNHRVHSSWLSCFWMKSDCSAQVITGADRRQRFPSTVEGSSAEDSRALRAPGHRTASGVGPSRRCQDQQRTPARPTADQDEEDVHRRSVLPRAAADWRRTQRVEHHQQRTAGHYPARQPEGGSQPASAAECTTALRRPPTVGSGG